MNRQQLLSRLGKRGWPVVYSTGTLSTWDRGGALWQQASWTHQHIETDSVTVFRTGRLHAYWPKIPVWGRLARRWMAQRMLRVARAKAGRGPFILFLSHPQYRPFVELLNPDYVVYHAYDSFSQMSHWNEQLAEWERELVQLADLIFCSSRGVADRLPADGPQRAQVLLNAVDADAFIAGAQGPMPADLAAIPSPRIGYVGRMSSKIDFALIAGLAEARPEWQWVLVGPVLPTDESAAVIERCRRLPNIHFLGERSFRELPSYTGHCDVNVIPYRQDEGWWWDSSPLKFHEYLAAGKPIVMSDFGMRLPDETLAHVADSPRSWEISIERALLSVRSHDVEAQRLVARANTWEGRVDQMEEAFAECFRRFP